MWHLQGQHYDEWWVKQTLGLISIGMSGEVTHYCEHDEVTYHTEGKIVLQVLRELASDLRTGHLFVGQQVHEFLLVDALTQAGSTAVEKVTARVTRCGTTFSNPKVSRRFRLVIVEFDTFINGTFGPPEFLVEWVHD